jgi:hypothetical protein
MKVMPVLYTVLWGLGGIFWIWMLVDCMLNEPDKYMWLWILFIGNIPAAIVYFIVKQPVAFRAVMPKFLLRITRGNEISRAELDVYNVPNAYNYGKLGDVYFELGDAKNAGIAYNKALEFDPKDISGLWGAAQADMKNKDYEAAKQKLESLLKIAPEHRFGDPALEYGRAFFELKDFKAAKKQLLKYLEKWSNPEAKLMLAHILADEGGAAEAGKILDEALLDIKGSPKFYYNKKRKWIGKIKALKSKLGKQP